MAVYNAFGQDIESTITYLDQTNALRAENGAALVRSFYPTLVRQFEVVHTLNSTDKNTCLQFYTDNKYLEFTFTSDIDGNTYTCIFISTPMITLIGGNFWKVVNKLAEVI